MERGNVELRLIGDTELTKSLSTAIVTHCSVLLSGWRSGPRFDQKAIWTARGGRPPRVSPRPPCRPLSHRRSRYPHRNQHPHLRQWLHHRRRKHLEAGFVLLLLLLLLLLLFDRRPVMTPVPVDRLRGCPLHPRPLGRRCCCRWWSRWSRWWWCNRCRRCRCFFCSSCLFSTTASSSLPGRFAALRTCR